MIQSSFFFAINDANRYIVRRAIEDELIRLKGRIELNQKNYNIEPDTYTLETIKKLESVLSEVTSNTFLVKRDGSVMDVLTF